MPLDPLPDAPSRATQTNQQFVLATDAFLSGVVAFVPAFNLAVASLNVSFAAVTAAAAQTAEDAERAEAAAAYRVSIAYKTWAELAAIAGTGAGQTAAVFDDAGTHTDPVVGGTVGNVGVYRWSAAPAGWEWLAAPTGGPVPWGDVTGKPSTFAPSAHTHAIADVTGLQAALDGKAAAGAVTASGLTMTTARLLGRVTAATGAVEQIELGVGLGFVDGKLAYTGSTDMVYPGAGIAVSNGSAWVGSLAVPSGALVGTTGAQTLTNKTLGAGTVISAGTISGATMTGGTLQAGVTVDDTGGPTATSPGFRGLPAVAGGATALAASHKGKVLVLTGNLTVPDGLGIGFACAVYNDTAGTIQIGMGGSDVLRHAGTADTGTFDLSQRGIASLTKVKAAEWVAS